MSTSYLPSPLSPTTSTMSDMPSPVPYQNGNVNGHASPHDPRHVKSGETYLPTPQSGMSYHHPQMNLSHSPSPHKYEGANSGQHYDFRPSVAGPSSYRRTPNLVSPLSVVGEDAAASRGVGRWEVTSPIPKTRARGRMTAQGEQVMMEGMERMAVGEGDGRIGTDEPYGERSYTELKVLGDGSFGTVWLCDWHSPVKPGLLLSAMQSGAGARPEWAGKRLVALKRMKRVWEGGWTEARNLGEIYSLSRIPQHPQIIPLYDAFISPKSNELYFVFECMEGNLYQLTKSRRGRPLAAGLIASCFHQITSGLHHIHHYGYFHRDMKPENLLVTTTGLADYLTASTLASINSARRGSAMEYSSQNGEVRYEKDVSVIIKLADFGLARAIKSKPPYTEYVSTRWYRAPEVLLRSTEYGAPVDMWALGTILAEMLNLKPLFPGVSEIDQVYRITETLGDPSAEYGLDERGKTIGGGAWVSGIKLAKNVGFSFPKRVPVKFKGLFNENVPQSLVDCIADLLRYNPKHRMTAAECIEHPYFHETLPHLQQTPPPPRIAFSQGQPFHRVAPPRPHGLDAPPRQLPPSHSHHEARPAFANGDMRTLPPPVGTPDHARNIFPPHAGMDPYEPSSLVNQLRELDLPTEDLAFYGHRPPLTPGGSPRYPVGQDGGSTMRNQTWAEGSRRPSMPGSLGPQGMLESNSPGPMYPHYTPVSDAHSKVAAFVQQQQQVDVYEDNTPRQPIPGLQPAMPPIESPTHGSAAPSSSNASSSKLAPLSVGKKKKWGLSSVFGGGDRSVVSLPPVDELGYPGETGSPSLKRTQSGSHPSERAIQPMAPLNVTESSSSSPSISDDPKKAKKEAEKAQREAERAKREAASRMQKERARAVMLKRSQLVAEQSTKKDPRIEHRSDFTLSELPPALRQVPQDPRTTPSGSNHSTLTPSLRHASSRELKQISGLPTSQSATSVRSHESKRSGHSVHSHHSQSHPILPSASIRDGQDVTLRYKARRRDEDDDHSMSSFDHNSLRSRSVLTVGTIDSDPGPSMGRTEQLAYAYSKDPLMAKRSMSSFVNPSASRLASISNPSLESQLARDFQAHATVASPSSTSLGGSRMSPGVPHVPSHHTMPGHDSPSVAHSQAHFAAALGPQGSAPTSPYGHPKGVAVSHGVGMGRTAGAGQGTVLPSIMSLEEEGRQINPMFQVPIQEDGSEAYQHTVPSGGSGTTLPPFSAIARMADSSQHHHGR